MKKIIVKRNRYVDSVTLMSVGETARKEAGVEGAEAVMGTFANLEMLKKLGYTVENAGANDLILAADGTEGGADRALQSMEEVLNRGKKTGKSYRSAADPALKEDGYSIVQISLPGKYAGAEAMRALKSGMHVFAFSDNVSLEEELALKRYATDYGLLMMGPDCGVAQINGVCLGAGSVLSEGRVGIVGASGSGAQEVACLIESMGEGISQLIGTGGRDLYPEIGGLSMLQGMKLLDEDEKTEIIVLVSKLADTGVMKRVLDAADALNKPAVAVFLGGTHALFKGRRTVGAESLEEAAVRTVEKLRGKPVSFGFTEGELDEIAVQERKKYGKEQKYLRGLYCGGTFAEEGLIYYSAHCKGAVLHSNLNTAYTEKLADKEKSVGHTVLDLGAEDFTADAPHPVFEPKLRLKRLKRELADRETAVITLDFITGPGVHEDPLGGFVQEIIAAKRARGDNFTLIANVCGSKGDPQNVERIRAELTTAGVIVTHSNHETAHLAARLLCASEG